MILLRTTAIFTAVSLAFSAATPAQDLLPPEEFRRYFGDYRAAADTFQMIRKMIDI